MFRLSFLETPPHDDTLALLLTFGSANTWCEDFHFATSVPCPAHTMQTSRGQTASPICPPDCIRWFCHSSLALKHCFYLSRLVDCMGNGIQESNSLGDQREVYRIFVSNTQ
jgi:hypothetical protein